MNIKEPFQNTINSNNSFNHKNNPSQSTVKPQMKNAQNFSTIMPICIQQLSQRENQNISEFECEKSIYKSFIDEFYTVRSQQQSPCSKFQKKKIFDNDEIVNPVKSKGEVTIKLNTQEHQSTNQKEPVAISHHKYLENQTRLLSSDQLKKYKLECLKDAGKENLIIFKNDFLQILLSKLSLNQKVLNCQIIFQNICQQLISSIDIIYTNDQTLKLSKEEDCIKKLLPNCTQNSNLSITIQSIPFTLVTLSIEFNGEFYSIQLPITIFNFVEDCKIINVPTLKSYNYHNKLIFEKTQNNCENKIVIGKIANHDVEIIVKKEKGQTVFISKNNTEQINWQVLNTLYYLFDL